MQNSSEPIVESAGSYHKYNNAAVKRMRLSIPEPPPPPSAADRLLDFVDSTVRLPLTIASFPLRVTKRILFPSRRTVLRIVH